MPVLSPFSKHDIAPRDALQSTLWGDERRRKAPAISLGSGAYVHRITVGSLVFDFSLPSSLVFGMTRVQPSTLFFKYAQSSS